jgi:ubiquinone/menaquinone biosynthesis C-methylase UbiE
MVRTLEAKDYRRIYTDGAADYDRSRFGPRRGHYAKRLKNERVLDILRRHGLLRPDARLLDLATGTGRIAHDLLAEPVGRVFGADLTRAMLLKNRAGAPDGSRLSLAQADMRRLAFRDEAFDAVTIGSFFYLVPEAEYTAFTRDVRRVLKPGGLLVCEVANSLTLFNPLTLGRIAHHKHVKKKAVKSFVSPLALRGAFPGFQLEEVVGVEYPLLGRSYAFYRFVNRLLGGLPLVRWTGGKVIAVLRKD